MRKNRFYSSQTLIFCLQFFLLGIIGFSQTHDFASWNALGVKYKINKKWSVELEQQLRLKENVSSVDEYFTEFQTEYSITKKINIGAGFRFIRENDTKGNIQGYENHIRFHFDASYKHKLNDFSIAYRLRYQNKNELGVTIAQGDYANQNIRFKTSIEYNIKNWKLDPEISAEIFNRFQKNGENGFNKYRLTIGTDYNIKGFGKINIFYGLDEQFNVSQPKVTNIIGLKCLYLIKN